MSYSTCYCGGRIPDNTEKQTKTTVCCHCLRNVIDDDDDECTPIPVSVVIDVMAKD